jgi:peptide/nickel transport system permease protein
MKYFRKILNSYFVIYFSNHPLQAFGLIYVLIAMIMALIGPLIIPYSPTLIINDVGLLPPSKEYWFGLDANGMDVFSRCIFAFRVDLIIAFLGAIVSAAIGTPLGVFIGYFDGKMSINGFISMVIMRFEDVIQAFPIFVAGLLLVSAFGARPINLIMVIFIINHISFLRLTRTEVLIQREKTYVEAARASGNTDLKIAFLHIMPNALNQSIGLLSAVTGYGILLTAGLSFVGAGVSVPTPEWGSMISIGAPSMLTGHWWPSFFPGIVMVITIFSFSMLGQASATLLDPLERVRLGYTQ